MASAEDAATDDLIGCLGVMGMFMQPQGHLQVISALFDDCLDPQTALERPRFCIADGTAGGGVSLEEGIPVSAMSALAQMGHPVTPVSGAGRSVFGRGQVILRDPESGVLCGGSDPRGDGCAMTY
jgi:gamma-glutamyltranspeptidase/glutathione hydrolase